MSRVRSDTKDFSNETLALSQNVHKLRIGDCKKFEVQKQQTLLNQKRSKNGKKVIDVTKEYFSDWKYFNV